VDLPISADLADSVSAWAKDYEATVAQSREARQRLRRTRMNAIERATPPVTTSTAMITPPPPPTSAAPTSPARNQIARGTRQSDVGGTER